VMVDCLLIKDWDFMGYTLGFHGVYNQLKPMVGLD